MKGYIVTEGASDAVLLRSLLEAELPDSVGIVAAGGRSSVVSFAKSILVSRREPVALVMDADTIDPAAVRGQEREVYDLLRAASYRTPFRLFLAVPELEALLFADVEALSRLVGVEVTWQEAREAEVRPGKVLDEILGRSPEVRTREALLARMGTGAAGAIRGHPLLRDLSEFVRQPTAWDPWKNAGAA